MDGVCIGRGEEFVFPSSFTYKRHGAELDQRVADGNDRWAVHSQGRDGCAAGGRDTKQAIPAGLAEMVGPMILARMKQRNPVFRQWISSMGSGGLPQ